MEAEGTGALTLSVPQSFLTDIKLLAIGNKNWALTLAQHDTKEPTSHVTKQTQRRKGNGKDEGKRSLT